VSATAIAAATAGALLVAPAGVRTQPPLSARSCPGTGLQSGYACSASSRALTAASAAHQRLFDYIHDETLAAQYLADPSRSYTPRQVLAVAFAHPPLFAPGTSWSYTNTGYVLIGLVLERVTGRSMGSWGLTPDLGHGVYAAGASVAGAV
jgi:hypothetical protein